MEFVLESQYKDPQYHSCPEYAACHVHFMRGKTSMDENLTTQVNGHRLDI